MISADAGIWLAFFRDEPSTESLRALLQDDRVSVHPLVLIELRLRFRGPERKRILTDLERLVACSVDPPEVVSAFVEERGLGALDVDVVGAHLLASAVRCGDELWASERALRTAAIELKVAFVPDHPPRGKHSDNR